MLTLADIVTPIHPRNLQRAASLVALPLYILFMPYGMLFHIVLLFAALYMSTVNTPHLLSAGNARSLGVKLLISVIWLFFPALVSGVMSLIPPETAATVGRVVIMLAEASLLPSSIPQYVDAFRGAVGNLRALQYAVALYSMVVFPLIYAVIVPDLVIGIALRMIAHSRAFGKQGDKGDEYTFNAAGGIVVLCSYVLINYVADFSISYDAGLSGPYYLYAQNSNMLFFMHYFAFLFICICEFMIIAHRFCRYYSVPQHVIEALRREPGSRL